jgi:hypothetical protein
LEDFESRSLKLQAYVNTVIKEKEDYLNIMLKESDDKVSNAK